MNNKKIVRIKKIIILISKLKYKKIQPNYKSLLSIKNILK